MAMYAKVRRMRLREGLSISEIARRTSLSRNTIKDWLRGPVRDEMQYRRAAAPKKIAPYEAVLREALAIDTRRPHRERPCAGGGGPRDRPDPVDRTGTTSTPPASRSTGGARRPAAGSR